MAGLLLLLLIPHAPTEELRRYEQTEPHLGSTFTITLFAPSEEAARDAFQAAFAEVERLNGIYSDYEPESELNRLSGASPTPEPVLLSPELARVLRAAESLSRESRGAFDVTVGPLTKLWRQARRRRELPEAEELHAARAAVGHRHVVLSERGGRTYAQLTRPGMRLDLGGIAKGEIAEAVVQLLAKRGLPRVLVNAGGDLVAGEAPPGQTGWLVGVAPLEADAEPGTWLRLAHRGVATSGDAFQFVELGGVRYSHLVDPRTGLGLTRRASVTVLAPGGMAADAYASALSVLGPEKGLALIEPRPGLEALFVYPEEGRIVTRATSGFARYTTDPPASR